MIKIGIIREGKTPPDTRVPLPPKHCRELQQRYPDIRFVIQPSPNRCFTDEEYRAEGLELNEDLSDCRVLLGVKEVPVDLLLAGKVYFFFSHTIKEQPYNRGLLQTVLERNIRLIDYECLVDEKHFRVIGFGRWAGIVGAYNGLMTWAKRTGEFDMPRMTSFRDYAEALATFKDYNFKPFRIVLTGGGRVARGAAEVLDAFGIRKLSGTEFLDGDFSEPVYTQLDVNELYRHEDGRPFDFGHFFGNPGEYLSSFGPFTSRTDLMINGIYWDPKAPAYFSAKDIRQSQFRIGAIADITCDIAPEASIPATLRASTIADPFFGYSPSSGMETKAFIPGVIDMMTIDNLPNELPRDASTDFGDTLAEIVIPELLKEGKSRMLHEATIAMDGKLNEPFRYLEDYVNAQV